MHIYFPFVKGSCTVSNAACERILVKLQIETDMTILWVLLTHILSAELCLFDPRLPACSLCQYNNTPLYDTSCHVTHFADVDHILYNILLWRLESRNSKAGLQRVLSTPKSKIRRYRLKAYKLFMQLNKCWDAVICSSNMYLCPDLSSGLFSVLPTIMPNAFLLHVLLISSSVTWWSVQVKKLQIMYFSLTSCYFISLWSKYSPRQPVPYSGDEAATCF
jgi:hypothetical protein